MFRVKFTNSGDVFVGVNTASGPVVETYIVNPGASVEVNFVEVDEGGVVIKPMTAEEVAEINAMKYPPADPPSEEPAVAPDPYPAPPAPPPAAEAPAEPPAESPAPAPAEPPAESPAPAPAPAPAPEEQPPA